MEDENYGQWTTSHKETSGQSQKNPQSAEHHCYTCIIAVICVTIIAVLGGAAAFYWYIFEYREPSSMSTTYVEVPISLRLDMDYMDAYMNPISPEYIALTNTYTDEVDRAFTNTSLDAIYRDTKVTSLRSGSVLVNSSTFFDNKSSSNRTLSLQVKLANLRNDIALILDEELSDGMLGNSFHVDPNSSLFVGAPVIIAELPDIIIPVTNRSPTTSVKSTQQTTEKTPTLSTTIITAKPQSTECQSPSNVTLEVNLPFELLSPSYPSNYPPDTTCQWFIRAPSGRRVRAHFNELFLQEGLDFLYVGTGPSTIGYDRLAYTGTTAQVPLDIISPEEELVFTFKSRQSVGARGFSVRFETVDPPGEDLVTCNNGLEVLVADDICDARVECHDGSDETDCHDLLRTGICGTKLPYNRILGGQNSHLGSMPWMGSVRTSAGAHYCGATLLTDQWAITAAHCVQYTDHLSFGGISLDTPSDYEETIPISVIFAHPEYELINENHDIALIRLARPVKISVAIRPICVASVLETMDEVDSYSDCRAVGWGTANSMGGLSPVLKEVEMPLIPRDQCAESSDNSDDSSNTKICAGGVINSDTCTGDNGGPLVCRGENNLWHLVGITTKSSRCKSGDIDVYTRISAYHSFILHTVTQTDACIGTPFESFCLNGCVGGKNCDLQCFDGQISCKVGNCIPDVKACDGTADCLDSTDEGATQNCASDGCGGEIAIVPESALTIIVSPGYPDSYQSFQRCQWTVTTTPGNRIKLQFDDFETEELYDVLHIGDSITNSAQLSVSGDNNPLDVLSLGNTIVLTFETDYSFERKGFSLKVVSVDNTETDTLTTCTNGMQIVPDPQIRDIKCNGVSECFDNSDEVECACGDRERTVPINSYVEILSNNYGNGGYPEGSFPCQWVVKASSEDRRLELTFIDFKTESGYDFLSVATSLEENATVVSYSGHNIPPRIVSPSSELVITFTTDLSGSAEGIRLEVADIPVHLAEGLNKCENNFEVLAAGTMCDGIVHCSDRSDEPDKCKCGESTLLLVPSGFSIELMSANFPSNYLHSTTCLWLVVTEDTSERLHLHFNDFSLEDTVDYLNISTLSFTGDKRPLDVISPNVGELLINFRTDHSISRTGFSVTLSGMTPTEADSNNFCDNGLEVLTTNDVCNTVIDCSDGSDEANCGSR